jgi:hypothetical protein
VNPRPDFSNAAEADERNQKDFRKSEEEIRAGTIVARITLASNCTPMGRMASGGSLAYFTTSALADLSGRTP